MNDFKLHRRLIALFALAGLGIMSYLSYIGIAQKQSFCDISEGVSCDVVVTSIYSDVFGIPISFGGFAFFALILALAIFWKKKEVFQTIFLLSILMLVPSLYFTLTEIFFIKTLCILCETSKLLMLAIIIISGLALWSFAKITVNLAAPVIIAGLVASGLIFLIQSGGGTNKDYSEIVGCMNDKGVIYYKSVRCSNCRRQEKLLGVAYPKLNAIECHPDGENPQVELCFNKKIDKTPSFLIEDERGNELKRLEGLHQVKELAEFAGCEFNY